MQVRGAPLIGAAAAYGIALAAQDDPSDDFLHHTAATLIQSRPTAVNLRWAVERLIQRLGLMPIHERNRAAWLEAAAICDEDITINRSIGQHGFELIKKAASLKTHGPFNILTHCNAGWLATVDWGTALVATSATRLEPT
jgi:methylthioribose-1-phosphate isomerase